MHIAWFHDHMKMMPFKNDKFKCKTTHDNDRSRRKEDKGKKKIKIKKLCLTSRFETDNISSVEL